MNIEIAPNSRVFITGKTGSGKTHLSKEILSQVDRLVVFDPKDNLSDDMDLVPIRRRENWRRFVRGYPVRLQVSHDIAKDDDIEYYHNVFRDVFAIGDCMVYIDELLSVVKSSVDLPKWLKAIYTRGREPRYKGNRIIGGNIGVVACTQRPAHIPVFCMTESEEFFVFQLQNPDDRKKVAAYTSPEIAEAIPDEHGFYYYKTRSNQPVYVKEL
jgi:energy-coupling factor transporter ATP-binding protein EcfA2